MSDSELTKFLRAKSVKDFFLYAIMLATVGWIGKTNYNKLNEITALPDHVKEIVVESDKKFETKHDHTSDISKEEKARIEAVKEIFIKFDNQGLTLTRLDERLAGVQNTINRITK